MIEKLCDLKNFIRTSPNLAADFLNDYKDSDVVVVYGCGEAAFWFYAYLTKQNVKIAYYVDSDKNKQGRTFMDIQIISLEELRKLAEVHPVKVVIGSPRYIKEISQLLTEQLGERAQVYSFETGMYYLFIKDLPVYRKYLLNNFERLENFYNTLADDESRYVLISIIKGRISGNQEYFGQCVTLPQYFPADIIHFGEDETLLEVVSNDGKTLLQMLDIVRRKYHKVYCVEPDKPSIVRLEEIIAKESGDIELIRAGAYSKSATLSFMSDPSHGTSHITENVDRNMEQINVVALDDVIKEPLTYMKIDIEGIELEAMKGAAGLLKQYKPSLAICVYHNNEDLLDIYEWIHALVSSYKLYLRHHSWDATETVLYAVTEFRNG